MALFRSLNRKFEGNLLAEVFVHMRRWNTSPAMSLITIECHEGKGGNHSCIKVELDDGEFAFFHLCAGAGYTLSDDAIGWREDTWAKPSVDLMAASIMGTIDFLNGPFGKLKY